MLHTQNTFLTSSEEDLPMLSAVYDGPLRYFTGHPIQPISEGEGFQLNTTCGTCRFSVNDRTVYSALRFSPEDRVHVLARKRKNEFDFETFAVCSTKDYMVFHQFRDLSTKLKAIRVYATMTEEQHRVILQQMEKQQDSKEFTGTSRVTSIAHKKLKFDLCANSFSPEDRLYIRNLFLENSNKNKNDMKLSYYLNIDPCPAPLPVVPSQTLVQAMDRRVFGLHSVKQQLAEKFLTHQPVLLIGGQRVCADLVRAISDTLSLPLEEIDVSGLSNALDLLGADATFDKAGPGKILESMYNAGTTQMLFHFSQLDRANTVENKEGTCPDALLHILPPHRHFEDHFLESSISTKDTFFIASATSAQAVPDDLRQRFFVIALPEYSCEELVCIAQQFMIPHILDAAVGDAVVFPAETLRHIADRYCEAYSAGRMKQHLSRLVSEVLREQGDHVLPVPYSVCTEFADACLRNETDETDPRLICHRNRAQYAPSVLKKLQTLSEQLKNTRLRPDDRNALWDTYTLLSGLYPRCDAADFDLKRFYEAVRSTHYRMDAVADTIAGEFLCSSKTPPRLFLTGAPGTGKTSVIQSLAAAVGWQVLRIPCNDPESTSLRKKIIRGLSKVGTAAILHLDELDKLSIPAANDLLDLLDNSCSVSIPELELTLDLSHLIVVATGNQAAALAHACPALANRLIQISMPGFTMAEKSVIARQYVLPRLVETYGAFEMPDPTLEFLLKHYCRTPGIRDVEQTLQRVLRTQKLLAAQQGTAPSLPLTQADILTALGTLPLPRGNFPKRVVPGLARGLAVTGDTGQGVSFAVETLLTPALPEDIRVTGLASDCVRESVAVCRSYLAAYHPEHFRSGGIHVHFGEAAVPTDGPSAGAALVVSMLSAMRNRSVPADIAFTGEIDLHGNLFAVGGIRQKVQAACLDGCSRVFIPRQNMPELNAQEFDIEIIPVDNANEMISAVFPPQLPVGLPDRPAV